VKTVLRIFGVIAVVVALAFGSLSVMRSIDDKKDAEDAVGQMAEAQKQLDNFKELSKTMTGESKAQIDQQIADAEAKLDKIPSPGAYSGVIGLLFALMALSLVFGVLLFKTNLGLATKLCVAAVVVMLACYFLAPDLERGMYGGMKTPTLALMTGIPAIISGLFAFFVAKKNIKATA